MEKINTEIFVSSLFAIGFDKVDAILYGYTLGKLSLDQRTSKLIEFEDEDTSEIFKKYIDFDGIVFKLKEGYTLDTDISLIEGRFWPLKRSLHRNKLLIEYLNNMDFSDIVLKKAIIYSVKDIDQIDESKFSQKEIDILQELNYGKSNNLTDENIIPDTLIDILIEARKKSSINMAQLARRIGVSHTTISRIEKGKMQPSLDMFVKYADSLGYKLELVKKEELIEERQKVFIKKWNDRKFLLDNRKEIFA